MKNYNQICLYLFILVFLNACNDKKTRYYQDTGEIFHTTYSIKYEYSRSLTEDIIKELNRFDNSLNPFKKESVISKVNNNEPVVLDSLFIEVFNKSQEVSHVSGGLFDITCSPFINAWGFGFKNLENITPQLIDSLKEFTGYEKIDIADGKIIKTDPRIQINTSAIAKGFSADIIARMLDSLGIENYMCEIGGEIVAKGINPKDECWHIGIDKPVESKVPEQRDLQVILQICNKAVATSGNYRNFYLKDGKKYAHTIDPRSGYPSSGNVLSATVIAGNCMTADAYATVFMLTSIEQAMEIARNEQLDIYIIYNNENGQISAAYSDGFDKYFIQEQEPSAFSR